MSVPNLQRLASGVLDRNWTGTSTKPSGKLYPHQWSWDSAFVAVGNAAIGESGRAVTELRSLFAAQWRNGMVPHMVFDTAVQGYHPSIDVWGTRGHRSTPPGFVTSGMCQPPVHAMAISRVAETLDGAARSAFLSEMYEPLERWHNYLHRSRSVGSPLLEIWHPWESGMDNSPLWDIALDRLTIADVPDYQRVDIDHTDASERPTDSEYDRYIWILGQLHEHGYEPADASELPFRVCDVLFNSVAAHADLVLAKIALELGDRVRHDELVARAEILTDAIEHELFDPGAAMCFDLDRITGEHIHVASAGGLVALLAPVTQPTRQQLLRTLTDRFAIATENEGQPGLLVPSVARDDPGFEPDRYWRGPVWANVTWLLIHALATSRIDSSAEASEFAALLRSGLLQLVEVSGCFEYYNPHSLAPRGASDFSWTAALVLDLLAAPKVPGSRRLDA